MINSTFCPNFYKSEAQARNFRRQGNPRPEEFDRKTVQNIIKSKLF
ncbi:hypothetical protein QT972_25820 [Microcoleus sp. herbarium7]